MSIIQSNNELLLRLINDILDLSKIESGILDRKRETFNLAKVCNELYTMIQPKITNPDVEFQMDNSSPDCWIFLDRSRLKQVWMNYLTNAVKCTKSGYIKNGIQHRKRRNPDLCGRFRSRYPGRITGTSVWTFPEAQ